MKPRTFLLLLSLILIVGGVLNYLAFQSMNLGNSDPAGLFGDKQSPGRVSEREARVMQQRGWLAGASGGANREVFRGAIMQEPVESFQRIPFPDGVPAYEGETVTAYVDVPSSGKKVALTPNQSGEYPKLITQPGEAVEVRLAFTRSQPGEAVAVSVQDGGVLHVGKMAGKLELNANREVGLGFVVSENNGIHRVAFTTAGGETKTLNFWAGPELPVNKRIAAQLANPGTK